MVRMTSKLFVALAMAAGASLPGASAAEPARLVVSGTVVVEGTGPVLVSLVDEVTFGSAGGGLRSVTLQAPEGTGRRSVRFEFRGLRPGVYGVRAYQDTNANGRLDRGSFGPSEPWGMSFSGRRPLRAPRFSDIAFELGADLTNLRIVLR